MDRYIAVQGKPRSRSARLMPTIHIPGSDRSLLLAGIQALEGELGFLHNRLQEALGAGTPSPKDVGSLRQRVGSLRDALSPGSAIDADTNLPEEFGPVLKTVLLAERRKIASRVDSFRRNTQHPELLMELTGRLAPFAAFAKAKWFQETQAIRIPQPGDYLTAQYLAAKRPPTESQAKAFDPKHGVLLSAAQLWADLPALRDECESRRVPVSILFLDVDDFKALNSKYGEPAVDRDLLPTLMRLVEGSFYGHGSVYRYGGDEFVAVTPNSPRSVLGPLLSLLRKALADADYPGIAERPTVSVGVAELAPGSPMTEDEGLAQASSAKHYAKQHGKNVTAGYELDSAGLVAPTLW